MFVCPFCSSELNRTAAPGGIEVPVNPPSDPVVLDACKPCEFVRSLPIQDEDGPLQVALVFAHADATIDLLLRAKPSASGRTNHITPNRPVRVSKQPISQNILGPNSTKQHQIRPINTKTRTTPSLPFPASVHPKSPVDCSTIGS